eukprot:GEMP01110777.1.p1 GENE.GEMP01110777.1~~GEMP01110777.1.p1  ORF type:complete len:149 (+),score=43.37 GEMP01110777.1:68-514(+)
MPILRNVIKMMESKWPTALSENRVMPSVFKVANGVAIFFDPYVDYVAHGVMEQIVHQTAKVFSALGMKSGKIEDLSMTAANGEVAVVEEVIDDPHRHDVPLVPTPETELRGGRNWKCKGKGKGARSGVKGKGKGTKGKQCNMAWIRVN